MKKTFFLQLFGFIFPILLSAQSVQEIKTNRVYIWGEGTGITASKADKDALSMLISQISSTVESDTKMSSQQKDEKVTINIEEVINTYSKSTIRNTELLSWGEEPNVKVIRYIKRSELNKIFKEREEKIREYVNFAIKSETEAQLSETLKYLYWSLILIQTHPEGQSIRMKINDKEELLLTWISNKINLVLDNINMSVIGKEKEGNISNLYLDIRYNGIKVKNCEYAYFDGRNWSTNVEAKDGVGIIELFEDASLMKNLRIRFEYMFESEWKTDPELNDIMQKVEPIIFKKSYSELSLTIPKNRINLGANNNDMNDSISLFVNKKNAEISNSDLSNISNKKNIAGTNFSDDTIALLNNIISKIEQGIKAKNYSSIQQYFTSEGYDMFYKLINYGQGKLLLHPVYEYTRFENGFFCRGMKMSFNFKTNNKVFVEDIVFYFSNEGKAQSCAFGMPQQTCENVLGNETWDEFSKMTIINLLENLKTAYALKRIDYLESIYDDNALIIVGSVLKSQRGKDNMFAKLAMVDLKQTTKKEYMKKLRQVFASSEFVNIKFEETKFKKAGKGGEIYGIQVKQDYFSSNYGDKGYLFLLVDLNNKKSPIIHVRAWQPEKDPNFGLVDVTHF